MKTVGIVVEYNPLHYGHVHHFQQAKQAANADAVIAVMSGHFLQRGEPAIVHKWARAEMALRMGVDLVIELPVAYAIQPAEWFAYGALSLLEATGVVDSLCFGSEDGEIGGLQLLAQLLHQESSPLQQMIKAQLRSGSSYPAAYSAAAYQFAEEFAIPSAQRDRLKLSLSQPNNTLGLHYLIAIARLRSRIQPLTIPRIQAGFHQTEITDRQIASATAIRKLLFEHHDVVGAAPYLPSYSYEVLNREWQAGRAPIDWERFAIPLFHQLLSKSVQELAEMAEVKEGLQHRIKSALPLLTAEPVLSIDHLLKLLKTKRYTRTKLQRMLLHIMLNHSKEKISLAKLAAGASYIRILGFSNKGQALLKTMKKTAKVPVISKVKAHPSTLLDLDISATSVYSLAYSAPTAKDMFADFYIPPIQQ